jgi:hypothetical protein
MNILLISTIILNNNFHQIYVNLDKNRFKALAVKLEIKIKYFYTLGSFSVPILLMKFDSVLNSYICMVEKGKTF